MAILEDGHGNLLSGATLTFTEVEGLTPASGASDEHGQLEVKFASTASGPVVLTAKAANGLAQTVKGSFVADAATPHLRSLTMVTTGNKTADGKDQHEALAILEDGHGNLLSGATLTFTEVEGLTPASGASDEHGQLEVKFASTASGPVVLTAKAANGLAQTVKGSFVADAATPHLRSLTMVTTGNKTADGKDQHEALAILEDGHGNLLSGATLTFTEVEGLTPASGASDEHGQLEVKFASTASGPVVLTAKAANGLAQTVKGSFVADAATPHLRSLTMVTTGNKTADGKDQHEALAILEDGHGNLLSGATLTFTEVEGLTPASGASDEHGQLEVKFASTASGPVVLTAKAANGLAQTVEGSFVADAATPKIVSLTAITGSDTLVVSANGQAVHSATATVTDEQGNLLSGAQLTFEHADSVSANAAQTGTDGTTLVTFTSKMAGEVKLTAKVGSSSQAVTLSFVADLSTAQLTVLFDKSVATAGDKDSIAVTVLVKDIYGNPIKGQQVGFTASVNASVTVVNATTDKQGQATATLKSKKADEHIVTATFQGKSVTKKATFEADKATAAIDASSLQVDTGVVANGKDSGTAWVSVKDANGNGVPNLNVHFTATNDVTVHGLPITTDKIGGAGVKLRSETAGKSTVTATINGGKAASRDTIFIADKESAHIQSNTLKATSGAIANDIATNEVTATVVDRKGNLIEGYEVKFSASNGATIASSIYTNAQGVAKTSVSTKYAGTVVVEVIVGTQVATVETGFVADQTTAKIIKVSSKDEFVANGKDVNPVVIKVVDAYDNPLIDKEIKFVAQFATVRPVNVRTDVSGHARVNLVTVVSGIDSIQAALNDAKLTIEFNAEGDKATAKMSMGTETPNSLDSPAREILLFVYISDANDNPLAGIEVVVTNNVIINWAGGLQVVSRKAVTNHLGLVEFKLSSPHMVSSFDASATVSGKRLQKKMHFYFIGS
ncbi:Ig-like domain-containing protein [Pseudomonas sp. MDT1-17]